MVERGKVRGSGTISGNNRSQGSGNGPWVSSLHTAEALTPQYEEFSPRTQDLFKTLRTLCDSVVHSYLSKVADTEEKRNYVHAMCTAVEEIWLMGHLNLLGDDLPRVLDLNPSLFPCEDLHVFIATITDTSLLSGYLRDFLSDRERSRMFHYDPGLWNVFVATRLKRYLETTSNKR